MPLLLAQVILSWLSGLLTAKTGNYRYILMVGYFIMTVAAGAYALVGRDALPL